MHRLKKATMLAAAVLLAGFNARAGAATAVATMNVSVTVVAGCEVSSVAAAGLAYSSTALVNSSLPTSYQLLTSQAASATSSRTRFFDQAAAGRQAAQKATEAAVEALAFGLMGSERRNPLELGALRVERCSEFAALDEPVQVMVVY